MSFQTNAQQAHIFQLEYQLVLKEERLQLKDQETAMKDQEIALKNQEIAQLRNQVQTVSAQYKNQSDAKDREIFQLKALVQDLEQQNRKNAASAAVANAAATAARTAVAKPGAINHNTATTNMSNNEDPLQPPPAKKRPATGVPHWHIEPFPAPTPPRTPKRAKKKKSAAHRIPWNDMYHAYLTFQHNNNGAEPKKSDDAALYAWASEQREILSGRTAEYLTKEQIEKLTAAGIQPKREWKRIPWDHRFEELKRFQEMHGHCSVKQHEDASLSNWVLTMRKTMKAINNGTKSNTLTDERIAKLDSIGFTWEEKAGGTAETWERRFNELLEYKSEHGTPHVPRGVDTKLHAWCKFQRKKYRQIQKGQPCGLLTNERISRLSAIGFRWHING